mgnify:CR=1 FL=1
MKKSKIITTIYGYAICLIAVIVVLICVSQLVFALIDLSDPIHSGWNSMPNLASFENYKMDVLQAVKDKSDKQSNFVPSDNVLRNMYKAARLDKINMEKHKANRDVVVNILMILISSILFFFHWRWMRKM